jgi:hypothetical protein
MPKKKKTPEELEAQLVRNIDKKVNRTLDEVLDRLEGLRKLAYDAGNEHRLAGKVGKDVMNIYAARIHAAAGNLIAQGEYYKHFHRVVPKSYDFIIDFFKQRARAINNGFGYEAFKETYGRIVSSTELQCYGVRAKLRRKIYRTNAARNLKAWADAHDKLFDIRQNLENLGKRKRGLAQVLLLLDPKPENSLIQYVLKYEDTIFKAIEGGDKIEKIIAFRYEKFIGSSDTIKSKKLYEKLKPTVVPMIANFCIKYYAFRRRLDTILEGKVQMGSEEDKPELNYIM